MKYYKATLTTKFPLERLTAEEKQIIREGWEDLRQDIAREIPEGVIAELKIEEVEE